jgi:hypothetical protein
MRLRGWFTLAAAASIVLGATGCSDNTAPATTPPTPGTYSLTSFAFVSQGSKQPVPGTTGTLILTATTYNVTITIPGQGTTTDQGTWSASGGGQWSQASSNPQGPQSMGTYTFVNNVLTVDATAGGVETVTVWQK